MQSADSVVHSEGAVCGKLHCLRGLLWISCLCREVAGYRMRV